MRGGWLVGVAMLGVAGASAQAPFRAGTDIVPIYATVRGADGHLMTGLKQADFTILDRGVPTPVALFSNLVQPITLSVMVDMAGQIWDAKHFTALHEGLDALIDHLGPDDRARIGTYGGGLVNVGFHLTSDHRELRRVVSEEVWGHGGARSLWNALGLAMQSLANEPGRRVVLILADGPNTASLPDLPGPRVAEDVMRRGEPMVYGMALHTTGFIRDAEDTYPRLRLMDVINATGGGYFEAYTGRVRNYYIRPADGRYIVAALAGVIDELRHQYLLGFVPAHRDGQTGTIEVRVNSPGASVGARKSYVAPAK